MQTTAKIMPWADSILSDKSDQPSFGNWPANHPSSLSQIYPVTPHRDDHTTALFVVITTTVASICHCPATAFRIPNHAPFFDQIGHFILTLYNGFATCYRRFRCRWRHWWSTVVKISGPPQTWRATGRNSWWRRIWSSLKKAELIWFKYGLRWWVNGEEHCLFMVIYGFATLNILEPWDNYPNSQYVPRFTETCTAVLCPDATKILKFGNVCVWSTTENSNSKNFSTDPTRASTKVEHDSTSHLWKRTAYKSHNPTQFWRFWVIVLFCRFCWQIRVCSCQVGKENPPCATFTYCW